MERECARRRSDASVIKDKEWYRFFKQRLEDQRKLAEEQRLEEQRKLAEEPSDDEEDKKPAARPTRKDKKPT